MVSRDWLRRAHIQLDKIERERALRNQTRENDHRAPGFSVVIDERVRLEFSAPPRSVGVGTRQVAGGSAPKREALILEVEVW
jgi:hypothetical protein